MSEPIHLNDPVLMGRGMFQYEESPAQARRNIAAALMPWFMTELKETADENLPLGSFSLRDLIKGAANMAVLAADALLAALEEKR